MQPENVVITAHCLCRKHTFTASLPTSSLPLEATVDHSDGARYLTGGLFLATAPWPTPQENVSTLKAYTVSKTVETFSCATCSSQMFQREDGQLRVITGVLGKNKGLVQYSKHTGMEGTKDGGAAPWFGQTAPSEQATSKACAESSETELRCHCGGVHLVLHGARAEDAEAWRAIVDPESKRYLATLDACDSCRTTVGSDIVCWAFAPIARVKFAGEWFGFPTNVADLKAAVLRGVAGLGTMKVTRPKQVDITVGLLRRPDGARANGALSWALGRADYLEDVKGGWRETVINGFVEGSERWRVDKGVAEDFLRARGDV
ncbi:DUF636 domain-containing protein [Verticillium alfalfae VaMs.102]|uniref:DUF636 domain-containing protein n=1 Tax=Verticillium alfalfae (strain VaMs.102 / ATCC MYA-4576 / FGSC 10136) TaxID=526221 RepID=C9SKZ8_VERA1|nr:DUF636 domain-containing protein [Verticillium alfalfae VaMs.102]EEY19366.1 DUF636 domain-containing protein [Verticillium alfalfae VaMs.102]